MSDSLRQRQRQYIGQCFIKGRRVTIEEFEGQFVCEEREGPLTTEGWRLAALQAVEQHQAGDSTGLDLLARLLFEQDEAKGELRRKGYGWTGLGWIETVDLVPRHDE